MKIGVIGSINMDQTVVASRIPLKGETLMGQSVSYNDGGKGANQAVALARLGADVCMFGKVGDDANGKILLEHLKNNNVDVSNIGIEKGVPSGLAIITVGENDNTIIVVSGANSCVDKKYVDEKIDEIKKCDMIIMQHEIPLETNEYIIKICKENNIKTLLNPAPAMEISKEVIDNVDYLTPNEHEVLLIFKGMELDKILKENKEKVIVTLGSEGVITCKNDGTMVKVPCRKNCKIVDTTGAGDTFNGAFAYGIVSGKDIENALIFANIAAGMSIEKMGAQGGMPTIDEVMKEYKE